jgi:predicted CXXCH cytochrome family protein
MSDKMQFEVLIIMIIEVVLLSAAAAMAASVVGSKHDLKSGSNTETCAFCHTPHFANAAIEAPLWNKRITNMDSFTMYSSPTINTSIPSRPSGVSLACLGCHDDVGAGSAASSTDVHGVINAPGSGLGSVIYGGNCTKCHNPRPDDVSPLLKIGPNLTNDHPISMTYPTAAQDTGFFIPPNLQKGWSDVPLYGGKVECPTCHNVHDPSKAPFLRIANTGSALCLKCHKK